MNRRIAQNETAAWSGGRDRAAQTERTPTGERLALILDAYMSELEQTGVPPDLDKLIRENPDLAEELRSYVDSLHVLHQMTAGLRPPTDRDNGHAATASPAKRLGDYELVREIGRGGMGVVYEARQLSLNRQVALKVLPFAAMLDERQIARFRTEAQAAAQLHHPNIVQVYAVGQERGVHYFAMQFIAGQSLEAAINELREANAVGVPLLARTAVGAASSLPTAGQASSGTLVSQREVDTVAESAFSTRVSTHSRTYCHSVARLILQAADALHHAHQLGVIHRDVKPSNLLLDRSGRLWVTDFGLARIQTDSGVTISGDIVGTVRYMSPEQAAGSSALVDARTDVYALGATMYELLTLQPAHRGNARPEILRHIEVVEPTSPRSLNPSVPFDLETITLRALSKSRDERYATAQEFADDLRRFLNGEPTQARRPTLVDRAVKWSLRHRKSVALAAAFMVTLTIVSAGAAIMVMRETSRKNEALQEAKKNLARAEEHYQQARQMVDQSVSVANQLAGLPGAEPIRQWILGRTQEYYRQFIVREANDAGLSAELAAAYHKAATLAETLGDRGGALEMSREAIELFDKLAEETPEDNLLHQQRASALSSFGFLLAADGKGNEALESYAKAIAIQRAVAKREPGAGAPERSLAESFSNLGLLQGKLGDKERARTSLQASIDLLKDLLASSPTDSKLRHDLAIGYNNLSYVQRVADWEGSEQSCRRAIEILERLASENEPVPSFRSDLALCYNNFGAILGHRDQWQEACQWYEKAIELQRQLTRQAGAVVAYRRELAVSLNNLGQALQELDDHPAAIKSFDDAEEIVSQLVEDYPNELTFRSLAGAVLNNRAMALEASHQNDAALPAYEKAIAHQRVAQERAPQVAEYREFLSKHYFNYGRALRAASRPMDAAEVARQRRQLWPQHGDHLGQVAVELAQAAVQVRSDPSAAEAAQVAEKLEAEAAQMLREAAAHGADLAALRDAKALSFLQDDAIWDTLGASTKAVAP
jgi:serine/threonine protein kinase/tetratricopeptide (TPR) repeat protein